MYGIDLFSGAGGMSLGAELSGISVRIAIEKDISAGLTYKSNHPKTKLMNVDIASVTDADILKLKPKDDDLVLFGGPPCQGFSYSNPRHRRKGNVQNWLFKEFIRFVTILEPQWVVYENVRGIKDTARGFFLNQVISSLQVLGFSVSHGVLDASDFGVPQRRKRYFVVAHPSTIDYKMPVAAENQRCITVDDAIRDLPALDNGHSKSAMPYGTQSPSEFGKSRRNGASVSQNNLVTRNSPRVLERYAFIPQGGNWQDIPTTLLTNYRDISRCHTGIYHRLSLDAPSVVIGNFRKNMLIHPTAHRGLSVREAARLQSFPDDYAFYGSIGFQQQQVGNAVPPLLARAVFRSILGVGKKH